MREATSDQLLGDAYASMRAMILSGELAMGRRLVETWLAERLGLSRTPIREALRRLTSDGLVVFMPNRGYQVISFSARDVAEIYSCRALLESEAVRLAVLRGLAPALRSRLEELVAEAGRLFAATTPSPVLRQSFLQLNNAFHDTLYSACGNATLLRMIGRNLAIPTGIRSYFHFSDAQLAASQAAHEGILRAVLAGEDERAAALMREHIWTAKDRMIDPGAAAPDAENPRPPGAETPAGGPPVLSRA